MEVRGSVLKSIDGYVLSNHKSGYDTWFNSLSDETRKMMKGVGASKWYPVDSGVIEPTESMCNMFYTSEREGAWKSGRFSAEQGLSGIYKVFVLVSTPAFMLKRASRVLSTFYAPTKIQVANSTDRTMLLQIVEMDVKNNLVEYRIGGWMEKALEICGCQGVDIRISKSIAKGDSITEYDIRWDK